MAAFPPMQVTGVHRLLAGSYYGGVEQGGTPGAPISEFPDQATPLAGCYGHDPARSCTTQGLQQFQ
jgi:hypothetical protein